MEVKLIKQDYTNIKGRETYKLEYNEEQVTNKRYKHKPGIIVFLRDLFKNLEIRFEAYWSSIKFFINGKDFIIFQNRNKKSNIEWFHFSDMFRGKSIKPFLRRIKKFLVEKVGNHIKEIFENLMSKLDMYLGGLVEEAKEMLDNKAGALKPEKKVFVVDNTFHLKYFGLLRTTFKRGQSKIIINVAEEFYENNRDKFMKVIHSIAENLYEIYGKDVFQKLLTIRQRPAWLLS